LSAIRPLERGDLPQVVSLYEHVARSGSRTAPPGLAGYFERTFLDHPWADAEIPSLVYTDGEGRIVGFLGSSVRRLEFDGRPLRMGISGQLVTEPEARSRAAGAFLMREYMTGAQDLTITDTASEMVRKIWEGVGGETSQLACIGWVRILRPAQFATAYRTRERVEPVRRARLSQVLDAASSPLAGRILRPPRATDVQGEELTPAALARHLDEVTPSARLRPAYDEAFAEWLFRELAAVRSRGTVLKRLVRTSDGRLRGWYVGYLVPGGIAQVLQVAADERDVGYVLDHLFREAYESGAAALQGRLEPHLREPLTQRRAVFHRAGYLALVHARDNELLHAIQAGHALLTRLEGEWWMGHHLERFDDNAGPEAR
jgi:hypothetical protein